MGGEVRLGSVVLLVLFATGGDCLKERRNTSADILAWQALQAPFPSHRSRKPLTLEIELSHNGIRQPFWPTA